MKPITGKDAPEHDDDGKGESLFTSRRRDRSGPRTKVSTSGILASKTLRGVLVGGVGLMIGYFVATVVLFPASAQSTGFQAAPDLLGRDFANAASTVDGAGLVVGQVDTLHHPRVAAGTILGQSPLPGQLVVPAASVRLVVSGGAVSLPVPAVVGRSLDQAADLLEAAGFTFSADTVESDEPAGQVIGADPPPGERVTIPQHIALEVSVGPPMVTVPNVLGLDEADALQLLDSIGLEVDEVEERFRFGLDQGKVIEQEPAPGVEVEHGSEVRLIVGRRGGGTSP